MNKFLAMFLLAALAPPLFAVDYEPFTSFPQPAPGAFTVVGAALPDGRLAVWNGDTVFLQFAPDANVFIPLASGYSGDPAFVLYEPTRGTLLLGAGFNGNIYRFRLDAPEDFTPAAILTNTPHYSALLLTEELLLIDAGQPGFTGSELQIVELNGAKSLSRIVVQGTPQERDIVVEKPPFTYSASLALDSTSQIVYSMSAFGSPEELRYFAVADLLQAFTTGIPLDWSTDGTLIGAAGQFNSGGVAGILSTGELVMPGFGSIQLVDPRLDNPALATVVDAFDPTGLGGFYAAIFNPVTGVILAVDGSGNVYTPEDTVQPVPAAGWPVLLVLGMALGVLARKRLN